MEARSAARQEIAKIYGKLDAAIGRDDITDEHRTYLLDIRAQLRSHTETFLAQASAEEWRRRFRGYAQTVEDEIERVLRESKEKPG
jgi:hypothetical protein